MTVQQMTDEEYVRANWESCVSRQIPGSRDEDMLHEILIGGINATRTWCKTEAEAWAAAAEFTRGWREQIRLLVLEIEHLCAADYSDELGEVSYEADEAQERTRSRLADALADLKRGMKP